uniref:A-kinase anchor protein 6-like n=1 Tax=Phascolarctos cinereus TaxID=38626 RepID=A0A6P5M8W0_PHACI|nr:A-kinase anchor protein 6-like [Phascolarctos cinereus]
MRFLSTNRTLDWFDSETSKLHKTNSDGIRDEEELETPPYQGANQAEVQLCYLEAQRDAVEQMSLKLYSEQYASSSKRTEEFADMSKVHTAGSNGLLDFDSEYQELWDWLIDMESIVMDSHDLMMSEEQQQHLYKRYSVEMSIRHPKKMALLRKVEDLKKGGALLQNDLLEKVDSINEKWELLGKTLGEKIQDTMVGHSGLGPRDLLSPESGSLVRQLEVRIKELKGWLRDTELFIFNSCLRQEKEGTMNAEKQLQYFKSLCSEIKQHRRGVASVLRLCQHLLDDQETCNLNADHQPMQLIIVNLERRWEAIVMQAVQWQARLQKKLGNEQENEVPSEVRGSSSLDVFTCQEVLNVIDHGLMDLNGTSEDALEWDETDISNKLISLNEESSDLDLEHTHAHTMPNLKSELEDAGSEDRSYEESASDQGGSHYGSSITAPSSPHIYQVYSLHNVELYEENHMPFMKTSPNLPRITQSKVLTKSLSKDSSFSSTKSLPDLVGGITLVKPCTCHGRDMSQHSGSESGIVSEGDTETTTNSEMCLLNDMDGPPSNPETEHPGPHMSDVVNILKQKIKDEEEDIKPPNSSPSPASLMCCVNGKDGDLNSVTKHTPDCLEEELQGKHDVFTFYDYSYLQGSKLKLPMVMKQSQSEKAHVEDPLLHGFYFDKKPCKSKHQASELYPDAAPHECILASVPHEMDPNSSKSGNGEKTLPGMQNAKQLPLLSQSSSLESLSPGSDLFGSGVLKNGDGLQRSTSLESWLTSYKSNEDLFSRHSSEDISVSSGSVGQLSKRTLDLLNRLENIQSPSEQKIKRSVSDITLQSSSQKMSFTGQLDIASSINEDSAASLTELSSSDELSLCSEDIVLPRNKIPEDSNASFRKRLTHSVADESDVNVSMIVNVSCTSACTDDEDDSDLLSSSTLTLTEEELCVKDEDDSSIATDEEIYEECNLISGLDYIKNELQTWIRPKFSLSREKRRCNLSDEIQCSKDRGSSETSNATDALNIEALLNGSTKRMPENNGNSKNSSKVHEFGTKRENKKNISKVNKDPFMDDMENGNVESVPEKPKETPNGISNMSEGLVPIENEASERESCMCEAFTDSSDDSNMDGKEFVPLPSRNPPKECQNHLLSEIQSAVSIPTDKSCPEHATKTREIKESEPSVLKPSSDNAPTTAEKPTDHSPTLEPSETEENVAIDDRISCCNCELDALHQQDTEDCSVHNFVKEIIDMASTALKNKSQPESEAATPTSLAQIKEKVLEHSHRPIQLRKGDFYSYLSLSSHDSDCGEVTSYTEEKSHTLLPPDFPESGLDEKEDIECFFEACVDDEEGEQQCYFSSEPPKEAVGKEKDPISLEGTKTSSNYSGFSFSSEQTDTGTLSPTPQERSDIGKEMCNVFGTSNSCEASSALPAAPSKSDEESSSGKPSGSEMLEDGCAALVKTVVPGLPLKAEQLKDQAILHPNSKTLTCEENLLNLHNDRHINMHR